MFEYSDTVIVTRGDFGLVGKLGRVTDRSADKIAYGVTFYELREDGKDVDTFRRTIHADCLAKYENPHKLMRTLIKGDPVFIKEEFDVYFHRICLKYRGKLCVVEKIQRTDYEFRFDSHGIPWTLDNIDIPKTNALLFRKYNNPKTYPELPTI